MATALSSYFDSSFKSYFLYSTNQTNTTYSITVIEAGVWQECTWSEYNWKTVLSATDFDSRSNSIGVTYWKSGYHALITTDKTYTFERKTSAYTVTISAKSTQVATGKNATASKTFTVPALPSYKVYYNANGGTGAPSTQTKWYGKTLTLSSTKPTRSGYTFVGWGTSTTDTTADWSAGGSYTANASDTLYAIWKKTITLSYNANGGSNAPSSQSATVYNATTSKTFTISSTKPTRTGYTFLGWSTSSTGSASYSLGGSITLSASKTLYAVWKLNTYTVKYNANGGSNAPSSQTKSYGTDLKLTTSKPTRTNYIFKGWATSASGSVAYSSGGTYTANASTTLYAVWEVAYIAPRITSVSVKRCDADKNLQDDGTYALLKFKWATDEEVTAIKIERKLTTATAYTNSTTLSATGKSGSVSDAFGAGTLSIESAYHYRITVTDSKGSSSYVIILPTTAFTIDLLAGGKGVAIGKKAELSETFESAWNSRFYKDVKVDGKVDIHPVGAVVITNTYTSPSSKFGGTWECIDKHLAWKMYDSRSANFWTPSANTRSSVVFVTLEGHQATFKLEIVSDIEVGETDRVWGTFDFDSMGFSNLPFSVDYAIGGGDAANVLTLGSLNYSSGEYKTLDMTPKTDGGTLAAGQTFIATFTAPISTTAMYNAYCDKFYWRRTA